MNALLTQILMELKSGNLHRCKEMGLTEEEMQALNRLTVDDLHYLINTPVSLLSFNINHSNLGVMLKQAQQVQIRNRKINKALVLGGSIVMMQHFFGLTATDVSNRRRLAGLTVRQGRSTAPTEEEELAVWLQWRALDTDNSRSSDNLDMMMEIAEQQNVSLNTVWSLIKEWSVI